MDLATPSFFVSAVLAGFLSVRILKGSWIRNPQYLAVSIIGSIVGAMLLHKLAPVFDDDMILPTIACFIGSCLAVVAFDQLVGSE